MRAWDDIFMDIAKLIVEQSDEPSRKTSAVFVSIDGHIIASAANHFVRSFIVRDKSSDIRYQKPLKYAYIEHAERRAIYDACRRGVSLVKSTVYLPWFPCVECARALAEVRVARMVCVEPDWAEERYQFNQAREILEDAQVVISFYKEEEIIDVKETV